MVIGPDRADHIYNVCSGCHIRNPTTQHSEPYFWAWSAKLELLLSPPSPPPFPPPPFLPPPPLLEPNAGQKLGSDIPAFEEVQKRVDWKSSLHLQNPVAARELQISHQLERDNGEACAKDSEREDDIALSDPANLDEVPRKREHRKTLQFQRYLNEALLYILYHFSGCTVWYYAVENRSDQIYIDNLKNDFHTIIEEVSAIENRVVYCFQKLHDEVEAALLLLPQEVRVTVREQATLLIKNTERDITEGISSLLNFLHSPNWKEANRHPLFQYRPAVQHRLATKQGPAGEQHRINRRRGPYKGPPLFRVLHSDPPPEIWPSTLLPTPSDPQGLDLEGQQDKPSEHLFSHITISRDQTRASNYEKLKLLILQSRDHKSNLKDTTLKRSTPPIPTPPISISPIPKFPSIDSTESLLPLPSIFPKSPRQPTISSSRPAISRTLFPVPLPQRQPFSYTTEESVGGLDYSQYTQTAGIDSFRVNAVSSVLPVQSTPYNGYPEHIMPVLSGRETDTMDHSSLVDLQQRILLLEMENRGLKNIQGSGVEVLEIHCIVEDSQQITAYLDEPTWAIGPRGEAVPKAHFPIPDMVGYLRQKHNMAFSVQKHYNLGDQREKARQAARDKQVLPRLQPSTEILQLESQEMKDAFQAFLSINTEIEREFPRYDSGLFFNAPHLFWYHYRSSAIFDGLSEPHRLLMLTLTERIDKNYGELYARVETQLARGVVSLESMPFLVKPGDPILARQKVGQENKDIRGFVAKTYLESKATRTLPTDFELRHGTQGASRDQNWKWTSLAWSYKFDGTFYKNEETIEIEIEMDANDTHGETIISELNAFPMRFASEQMKALLEKRGREFWTCRKKRLVSYDDKAGMYGSAERFMVDFNTYKQLHSSDASFKREYSSIHDRLLIRIEPSIMEAEEPPPDPEIYTFPATIPAYNLHSKKWVDLEVDHFRQVKWNKQSFQHLVIEPESKELVQALITNQIAREQGTDIVENKGNGLIILLHGGPGTGKTFTAESVAEMAEKPLYRVTCGDIGTKPVEVEQYLESVLHLSKNWGCVVLLDEADVFLEQRSLTDLERNALVSVFLRVLEYYEGILILTSNRVGTFDEAFKSRIQLSLHYENLNRSQRQKIWTNFLSRLKNMNSKPPSSHLESGEKTPKVPEPIDIDFEDINCYIGELADVEMNGRQIRNAITTARQLARFKKEEMSYRHLKHVIAVSSKFDKYLKSVNEGFSDDQIMRDGGIR